MELNIEIVLNNMNNTIPPALQIWLMLVLIIIFNMFIAAISVYISN